MFDLRPFIGVALLPIAALLGLLIWRYLFRSSSRLICQIAAFALLGALYQFILFGPFVDQKRMVPVQATVTWRPDLGPDAMEFTLPDTFGFGGLISRDLDVAKRMKNLGLREVTVNVELTYDFGKARGMSLVFAYADGLLFAPYTER